MENNLYYIPTIEEFHVGFEYEIKIKDTWKLMNTSVSSFSAISDYDGTSYLEEDLINNDIRVKYLDQSDIESLGWKLSNQYDGAWWEWDKLIPDAEEMWHPLGNWKYRLSLDENMKVHIDGRNPSNGGQTKKFNGTIKNKSELIKLMKQLDIK
jgi:hypothetical protein